MKRGKKFLNGEKFNIAESNLIDGISTNLVEIEELL